MIGDVEKYLCNLWVIMIDNERNVHTWGLQQGLHFRDHILSHKVLTSMILHGYKQSISTHLCWNANSILPQFHMFTRGHRLTIWRICFRHVFAYYVGHLGFGLYLFVSTCGYPWYLNITSPMTWNYISHLWPTMATTLRKTNIVPENGT